MRPAQPRRLEYYRMRNAGWRHRNRKMKASNTGSVASFPSEILRGTY